jgi:hypothetical protein
MTLKKALVGVFALAILLVSAVGVSYSAMAMGMNHSGMVACPFMGHREAVCSMNIFEHLSAWQSMFSATPVESLSLLVLLLLALFFFSHYYKRLWILNPLPQFAYVRIDPNVSPHDSLRQFIARGLMHPKIF